VRSDLEASDDPAEELAALARLLRTHTEWLAVSGASGLPLAAPELIESRNPLPAEPAPGRASGRASAPPAGAGAASPGVPSVAAPVVPPAVSTPLDRDAAHARLRVLAGEVAGCTKCRLHETRTQTVFARGTGASGLCFIGEGPGADEDAQGLPFVGAAGQLLDKMIAAMGFERDEVYVANILKCRPPKNRKPEIDEMATCVPYLAEQIELVNPSVIVALGATAVQGLLGTTEGITRLRGRWRLYKGRIAVMPTFHPAYLLRTPGAKRDVWDDLQAVLRQMGRPIPARR
jgi:uracil-DNA glycosylase